MSEPASGSVTPKACRRSSPLRDLRQILPLLRLGAVPQQRAHHVHLRVGRPRVAAGVVDLFEDHRRLGEAHAEAAVLLRDERAEQPGLGHRPHERLRDRSASGPVPASTASGKSAQNARTRARNGSYDLLSVTASTFPATFSAIRHMMTVVAYVREQTASMRSPRRMYSRGKSLPARRAERGRGCTNRMSALAAFWHDRRC